MESKPKFKGRTISRDLTVSLVLMVVLVSMVTIFLYYLYAKHQEENRLRVHADEYLSYLKQSLELPIWTLDKENTVKIADSYFNNELVATLQINEVFDDASGRPYSKTIFDRSKSGKSNLLVRESDIVHSGHVIGRIRLGLTRRVYQAALHQLLWASIITMSLIILTLFLMTSIFFRRFMKKPFALLMDGIDQISKGNYDYQFGPVKQKEIQSIIANFRYMAGQVQKRETTLARLNKQLAVEVEERKKIEETIRNSEAQLRAIFESSADGILVVDNKGNIINANDRFYTMWSIPDDLRTQRSEAKLVEFLTDQLKSHRGYKAEVEKLYQTDSIRLDEIYFRDGRVFERFSCPLIRSGSNVGRVWNFRDVTDLKKSIRSLRESEKRFRQLSEAALEAIVIHDNGIIIQANDQFYQMFRYNPREVPGKLSFISILAPEYREAIKQKGFLELDGLRKDGTKFPVIVRNREMVYYGKDVTVSVFRDISDRKAAQEETRSLKERLARSKKMEALGLLAGGVAHDLNNILSGIVSYPELLLMNTGLDDKTRQALKIIQESGERAAAVVNDLTTISRGIASSREAININTIVEEYLASPEFQQLKNLYPDVTFETNLDHELFCISGSRLHIRKSIMNLVTNACEAVESNGQVVISTKNCYLDHPVSAYSDVQIGEYAVLSISDNGTGISDGEIDRIFEPFYTKKVMGRSGTGLGLTVVWNTVQDHNGSINVTSDQKGTTFDLYFPITREGIKESVAKLAIDNYMGAGQKILVVDDEKTQRDIACQMLTFLGYISTSVQSGEAAVEYLKNNPVDLIVLDMIMPAGMNGLETYELIVKDFPGQKAVIVSGFSITEDVMAAQKLGAGEFLKKPYSLEKLGMAVKQELSK